MTDEFKLTHPEPPDKALFDIDPVTAIWPMPDTHPQPKAVEVPFVQRVASWINRGLV